MSATFLEFLQISHIDVKSNARNGNIGCWKQKALASTFFPGNLFFNQINDENIFVSIDKIKMSL